MKICKEHFEELEAAIVLAADTPVGREIMKSNFPEERKRWDLLHLSRLPLHSIYCRYNDNHIDTALRSIVSKLTHKGE